MKLKIAALMLALSISAPAFAGQRGGDRLDTQSKGNHKELRHHSKQKKHKAKKNGQKLWQRADNNADGKISTKEMKQAAQARFEKLDRNHNGFISKSEFKARFKNQSATDKKVDRKVLSRIQRIDVNADGKVSKTEFLKAHQKRFSKLDRNGDGFISKQEARHRVELRKAEARHEKKAQKRRKHRKN